MSTPVPVRLVGPVAGIDPAATDGDGLAYDGASGTWRRDTATRAQLTSLDSRVTAIEQAAGGALKGYGSTGRLALTFGPFGNSGPWVMCPPAYRPSTTAAVNDVVEWIPELLISLGADSEHDLAAIVGGQPVRYASSGTSVGHLNGHGAMYLSRSGQFSTSFPSMVWHVQPGDLDNGTLTLALMYRDTGSGNTIGSAAYPSNIISLLNWGPVTASGDDLTGRVTALENSRGAAGGIATLDGAAKVPIAQLPVGTQPGTVAAGDDPRLSDERVPTAHAASHASVGDDPLSPAAIGALPTAARGAADGVAPLDSGLLVPIAYLPVGSDPGEVAAGDDPRLSDARTPLPHTHAQSDVTGLPADLAARQLLAEKNQPSGYAGLSATSKLDGAQQLYATQPSSIQPVGNAASVGTLDSAARSNHVHAGVALSGDQSVAGTKTFTSPPVVPDPTAAGHAVNRTYADTKLAATARGAPNGVASLDAAGLVPVAQIPTGTTGTTVALGNHTHAFTALTGLDLSAVAAGDVLAYNGSTWASSNRVSTLELLVPSEPTDTQHYGDVVSSIRRNRATNQATLDNGYWTFSTVMSPKTFTATKIRFYVASAGVAGGAPTAAVALYDNGTQVATTTVNATTFTTAGVKEFTLSASVNVVAGRRYTWLSYIAPASFTTSPGLAFTGVYYSGLNNPSPALTYNGYKAAAAALPASINTGDGTWTGNPSTLWWALL